MKFRLLIFILGFLFLQSLFAQEMCRHLFSEGAEKHLESSQTVRQSKAKYVEAVIKKAKAKLSRPDFLRFRDWYFSHFFYGRTQILMGAMENPNDYTPQGFVSRGQDPFLAYMIAREKVFDQDLQEVLTIKGLSEIQKDLIEEHDSEEVYDEYGRVSTKSSERTAKADQGSIRGMTPAGSRHQNNTLDVRKNP